MNICSVSGGKDSTALYLLMQEFYGHDFLPIFADTGNEHPVTVNYVRNLHIMAGGPQVVIVQADFEEKLRKKGKSKSESPFLDLCMWKGRAPSAKAQFCTEWLKLWPILLYLNEFYGDEDWVMFTGIRAAESERRRRKHPFGWNTYFDCEEVLPMLYESEDAVFELLHSRGVPPNPLYAIGYGRVGCFPCIHANKKELSLLPEWAWDKLEDWERRIGRTWFAPGTVPGIHIPKISDVRQWCRTGHGGRQFDMFKQDDTSDAPSCMSTWGICE